MYKILVTSREQYDNLISEAKQKGYVIPKNLDKLPYALVVTKYKEVLNQKEKYYKRDGMNMRLYPTAIISETFEPKMKKIKRPNRKGARMYLTISKQITRKLNIRIRNERESND